MIKRLDSSLRPIVLWPLLGALALTAWALLWPTEPATRLVEAQGVQVASVAAVAPLAGAAPLPAELPRIELDATAAANPFAVLPPSAAVAPRPPPAPLPAVAAAPVPPAPPSVSQRFLGRMTDPDGSVSVYLAEGDRALRVSVGTRLDNGYRITAIGETALNLQHESLGALAEIPVPPPAEAGQR